MKVYIATALERIADHNALRDALAAQGITLTYDWTAHGSVWREGPDRIREVAVAEIQGVLDADMVIVLLPGGRGTHTELGAAIAAGKTVLLVTLDPEDLEGPRTCAFYHHPQVMSVCQPNVSRWDTLRVVPVICATVLLFDPAVVAAAYADRAQRMTP